MTQTPPATNLDIREAARRVERHEKDKALAAQFPAMQEQNRIEGIKESARQSAAAAEANISTLLSIFKSHKSRYHLALDKWLLTSDDIITAGRELKQLHGELIGQYRQMIAAGFVADEGPAKDGFDARDRELRFGGQVQDAMSQDDVNLDYPPTEGIPGRLLAALGQAGAPVRPTSPPKERARFNVVQADGSVKVE